MAERLGWLSVPCKWNTSLPGTKRSIPISSSLPFSSPRARLAPRDPRHVACARRGERLSLRVLQSERLCGPKTKTMAWSSAACMALTGHQQLSQHPAGSNTVSAFATNRHRPTLWSRMPFVSFPVSFYFFIFFLPFFVLAPMHGLLLSACTNFVVHPRICGSFGVLYVADSMLLFRFRRGRIKEFSSAVIGLEKTRELIHII